MSGEVGTSRWSHEQTWLSARERDQLRTIERRLRREGLRLDVRDRVADWPFELTGLAIAAAGATLVAIVAAGAANPLATPKFWLGAVLVLFSALVAVTPMRAAARRCIRPLLQVLVAAGWFRRRPSG